MKKIGQQGVVKKMIKEILREMINMNTEERLGGVVFLCLGIGVGLVFITSLIFPGVPSSDLPSWAQFLNAVSILLPCISFIVLNAYELIHEQKISAKKFNQ